MNEAVDINQGQDSQGGTFEDFLMEKSGGHQAVYKDYLKYLVGNKPDPVMNELQRAVDKAHAEEDTRAGTRDFMTWYNRLTLGELAEIFGLVKLPKKRVRRTPEQVKEQIMQYMRDTNDTCDGLPYATVETLVKKIQIRPAPMHEHLEDLISRDELFAKEYNEAEELVSVCMGT